MAKSFRPGQLNPLTFSGRSSFATPDIITDNAMSVYHNSLSNLMAPNLLEGASEFTAVVLLSFKVDAPESSLFELIKSATVGTTSSDGPVGYCVCRIPEVHQYILDPAEAADPVSRAASIELHPIFEVRPSLLGVTITPGAGSVVKVRFLDSSYRHGEVTSIVVNTEPIDLDDIPTALHDAFAAGSMQQLPPMVSEDSAGFISEMRSSQLNQFSDAFLVALAANAQVESNYCANNAGDPRGTIQSTSPELAIRAKNCNESPVESYFCSFGYWQMNICSTGAGGQLFAEFYGIDLNNKVELYNAITNADKQFDFMYVHMQKLFGPVVFNDEVNGLSGEALAAYWGGRVAAECEKCKGCAVGQDKHMARKQLAADMYQAGTHIK